jgi:hypothetical protein
VVSDYWLTLLFIVISGLTGVLIIILFGLELPATMVDDRKWLYDG